MLKLQNLAKMKKILNGHVTAGKIKSKIDRSAKIKEKQWLFSLWRQNSPILFCHLEAK